MDIMIILFIIEVIGCILLLGIGIKMFIISKETEKLIKEAEEYAKKRGLL